jgi:branched-chain amino acid transport system permease protein
MDGGALRTGRSVLGVLVAAAAFAGLALIPKWGLDTHGVFSSELNSPGTLNVLALMLVFGGVALTYDLLFGFTGLLSFGHALYFALGVYLTAIGTTMWGWPLWQTLLVTALVALVVPTVLGSVSLRVGGIAFAMVTLAFAEAGSIIVDNNPRQWTGAEEGVTVDFEKLPEAFVGVINTDNLYWLALAYVAVVFVVVNWVVDSSPGRVLQAIRENERRVEVLGLQPFRYKLLAFVLGSFLATAGGVVYALILQTATPSVTTPAFTLGLLLMVVIGGAGTRWGAILGGALYTFLDNRLPSWTGSETIQNLPSVIETPLSEPLFVLGTLFILIVFFLPGGLAGLLTFRPRRGLRFLEQSVGAGAEPEPEPGAVAADEAGAKA